MLWLIFNHTQLHCCNSCKSRSWYCNNDYSIIVLPACRKKFCTPPSSDVGFAMMSIAWGKKTTALCHTLEPTTHFQIILHFFCRIKAWGVDKENLSFFEWWYHIRTLNLAFSSKWSDFSDPTQPQLFQLPMLFDTIYIRIATSYSN